MATSNWYFEDKNSTNSKSLEDIKETYKLVNEGYKGEGKIESFDYTPIYERWKALGLIDKEDSYEMVDKLSRSYEMFALFMIKREYSFPNIETEDMVTVMGLPIINRTVSIINDYVYPTDVVKEIMDFLDRVGLEKFEKIHEETHSENFDFQAHMCEFISSNLVTSLIKQNKYSLIKEETEKNNG